MLNIPSEVKALFSNDIIHKNFHVHFPNGEYRDLNNEDIVSESVQFTESLCSQQYFKFGLSEISEIDFTAVGIPNIRGSYIECAIEIDCTRLGDDWALNHLPDNTLPFLTPQTCVYDTKLYYRVPYGRFKVDTCPRDHGEMWQRQIIAYTDFPLVKDQIIEGEHPKNTMHINVLDWIAAKSLESSEMQCKTFSYSSVIDFLQGMSTSGGVDLLFTGISNARADGDTYSEEVRFYSSDIGVYAFRFDFQEHGLDNYAQSLYNKAKDYLPTGSYIYGATGKMFANNDQMLSGLFGQFSPCFYILVYDGTTYRYSKPVFIKPNQTFVIDMTDLSDLVYWQTKKTGTPSFISVVPIVPMRWKPYAYWQYGKPESGYTRKDVVGWEDTAPFVEYGVSRSGDVKVYYKKLEADTTIPKITLKSTLKYFKAKALGSYYTYSNALSTRDVIGGMAELLGRFFKVERDGTVSYFEMSENPEAIEIPRSDWSSFWWDENVIDSIGQVKVIYAENGADQQQTFDIGDGNSVYTIEDNEILINADLDESSTQDILDTYFAPNASVVNFTPADIEMRGLPYLESGDFIELIAEDGEVVQTYILNQTISGIQNLRSDISSTTGELLEVKDEQETD